ncbi:hypothetical protein AAFF_G00415000 [Aldrovandia affinis]|uniref:Uncharacterized protein n=1 Tax=Aldrovandia affinis TaxID=143900 RepID=A0AAD7SAQ2_9TELE|nr:hypothetical protein AAFF_G00415000 [Aldrovandia affinis]
MAFPQLSGPAHKSVPALTVMTAARVCGGDRCPSRRRGDDDDFIETLCRGSLCLVSFRSDLPRLEAIERWDLFIYRRRAAMERRGTQSQVPLSPLSMGQRQTVSARGRERSVRDERLSNERAASVYGGSSGWERPDRNQPSQASLTLQPAEFRSIAVLLLRASVLNATAP